jgi:hypothetical protein
MTHLANLQWQLTSYAATLERDRRDQARARRLQHLALAAATIALALVLAHTALGAAARVTADLITAEAMQGW